MTAPVPAPNPLQAQQAPDSSRYSPLGTRPRGLATGLGEILRSTLQPQEPYETPLWARKLTLPQGTGPALGGGQQQQGRSSVGFPERIQAPNIFGEGPRQQAPQADPFGQFLGSPEGQTTLAALGAVPGEGEYGGFYKGIATTPMTVANFATWGREGLMALLSSAMFPGGAYRMDDGAAFGSDIEFGYQGDLNAEQQAVKGIIEANKTVGDVVWGALDGVTHFWREESAKNRILQVRSLALTGDASRPILPVTFDDPSGMQGGGTFIDNVLTSMGIGSSSAKYSMVELRRAAVEKGVDDVQMAADFYDLPREVVAEVFRAPDMSDDKLMELAAGQPISQDALTAMVVEGGFMIGLMVGGGMGSLKALGTVGRIGGAGPEAFAHAVRGGRFAEGLAGGRLASGGAARTIGSSLGYATRTATKLNAINTAGGWTTRGLEWGIKQYGGIVGDEGLVRAMDELMREMPWSMNPGLNLIDGFTMHPLRHAKQLLGRDGKGRRIVIGDEGSFSETATLNLSKRRIETPETFYDRPELAPGVLDVDALTTGTTAAGDIRVRIAGVDETLDKGHPVAVLVERLRVMTLDDIYDNLLADLGWERRWVHEAFDSGKYDLTVDDLKDYLLYGYAQTVRDRGFSPLSLPGATGRERSRAFFRTEAPEILEAFYSDMRGETGHLAHSIKGQWWELEKLNDSNMAAIKARLREEFDPHVSFLSARNWLSASKRGHQAYLANRQLGDFVATYARRLNGERIRAEMDNVLLRYERGARISRHDISVLRNEAGPVEIVEPRLRKPHKTWTREQYLRLLKKLEQHADQGEPPPSRRLDPEVPEGWKPGDDFAADARVLDISPANVRLIENARRTGETPAGLPPRQVLEAMARDLGVNADSLALDPETAWRRAIAWYDDKLREVGTDMAVRDALLAVTRHVDAEAAGGRLDRTLAERIGAASDRIGAELASRPKRRPLDAKGPPPEGQVWADPRGLARWAAATDRARGVQGRIVRYLDDDLADLRVVGQELIEGEPGLGQFVVRSGDEGLARNVMGLLEVYADDPAAWLIDDTARALLEAPDVHPFLKMDALSRATPPPSLSAEMRVIKDGLGNVDEDALIRQIVAEVGDVTDQTDLRAELDGLTAKMAGRINERDALIEEILATDRSYDTIYGSLSPETRALIDRRAGAEVPTTRPLTSAGARQAVADADARTATITRTRTEIARAKSQEAELERQLREVADQEPADYQPPEPVRQEPETPQGYTEEPPDAPMPDWVRSNVDDLVAEADRLGLSDRIEELSAARQTAKDIRRLIEPQMQGSETDALNLIRAVRSRRGIPSMDDATEFEAWLARRQAPQPVAPERVPEAEAPAAPAPAPEAAPPPAEPAPGTIGRAIGMQDPTTESSRTIPGARLRVMDADDIIDSWDPRFDKSLQPRDTKGAMRQAMVDRIAAKPDPDRLLDLGPNASEGAPVVSPSGMAIVGNHRSRGIRVSDTKAYRPVKDELLRRADELELDPDAIRAMDKPVLVREVPEEFATRQYAEAWNVSTGGQGQSEIAVAMSQRIPANLLRRLAIQQGETPAEALARPANAEARREILAMFTERQRANFLDASGQELNVDGRQVFETAIYARVLGGDKALVERVVAASGREQKASGRLAAAIKDATGDLVEAEALISSGDRLAEPLGPTLGRTFDVLEAIEDYKPGAIGKVDPSKLRRLGASDEAIAKLEGEAAAINTADVEATLDAVAGDPVVAGLVRTVRDMDRTEIRDFLRTYRESVQQAPDPNQPTMFEALAPTQESSRSILNRAIESTNAARREKATGSMFEAQEIALIDDADGAARTTMRGADDGTESVAAEVAPLGSADDAIKARTQGASAAVVDSLEAIDGVAEGVPVTFRTHSEHLADALRRRGDLLEPAGAEAEALGLGGRVTRLTFEVRRHLDAYGEALAQNRGKAFHDALKGRLNNQGDLADLFMLRLIGGEKWSTKTGQFIGKYRKRQQVGSWNDTTQRLAKMEATLRRIDDVSGPGDAVPGETGTAAVLGGSARTVEPEYTLRTGRQASSQPHVDEIRAVTETGAEMFVRQGDEVTRRASREAGGLPVRGEAERIVILNERTFAERRANIQGELDRVKARRATYETQEQAAREAAAEAGGTPADAIELPDEAWELYQRYVYDAQNAASPAFGISRPSTVGQIEDVLRSLDYDVPAGDLAMTIAEREQLKVLLRSYLADKYDAWKVPAQPQRRPTTRVSAELAPGVKGYTPTEHAMALEELAQSLARKTFTTDDPLEGFTGTGYEFIPAPTKSIDGSDLTTRLFFESGLTDELLRYDQAVPGMGLELQTGRMATMAKRVDDGLSTQAARSLADTRFGRAASALADTAFGARRQQTIHEQAVSRFLDYILELTPAELRRMVVDPALSVQLDKQRRVLLGLVREWHKRMAAETAPVVHMRVYRRIGLLDPNRMETWTREYLSNAGDTGLDILARLDDRVRAGKPTPVWDAWRKADNRIRGYYADRDGGMAEIVEAVYESNPVRWASEKMSGLTVAYHVIRFLGDIRWLAMEFLEAPTLLVAREGPQALWDAIQLTRGKKSPELLFGAQGDMQNAMSRWAFWAAQSDAMATGGRYMRFRENAVFALVARQQQRGFVKALEEGARRDPRLMRMMADAGDSPAQYLRRLDRDWKLLASRQRRDIPEGEMRELLKGYVDEGVITPEEVERAVASGTWTEHPGLSQAIAHADDPVTRTLLRRFEVMTSQTVDDASQLIFGQVDRSNIQRLLNHPLLYWPISYQIKATKWLGGLLLDRVAGFETGAGGMVTMGTIWEANKQALWNDPKYHQFLEDNQEALFFLSMLLPITPWDMGVSLSPWTRLALHAVTEGDPAAGYQRNIFSVGPFYSYTQLFPRLIRERSEQVAGPLGDIARQGQRFLPVSVNLPPASGPPRGTPQLQPGTFGEYQTP